MDLAVDVDMTHDKNDREGSVKFIARYLRDALCVRRRKKRRCFGRCKQSLARCCLWCGPNYGNYLILLYLFCKCLFLANALSQFLIMYRFLGAKHSLFYGLEFVESVAKGIAWDEDRAFPREVYCDFEIKRMYNTHRYTVQCKFEENQQFSLLKLLKITFFLSFSQIFCFWSSLNACILCIFALSSSRWVDQVVTCLVLIQSMMTSSTINKQVFLFKLLKIADFSRYSTKFWTVLSLCQIIFECG